MSIGMIYEKDLGCKMKTNILFYHHFQETPLFGIRYRWKAMKGVIEFGVIIFGHWFMCMVDDERLMVDDERVKEK